MAELVAWVCKVEGDGDGSQWGHSVVYERSAARARVRRARQDGLELEHVTAERVPMLDAYAPGPAPADALLALGWWLPCKDCGHRVEEEGCGKCAEDSADGEPPEVVTDGEAAWCSSECRAATVARRALKLEATAAALSTCNPDECQWGEPDACPTFGTTQPEPHVVWQWRDEAGNAANVSNTGVLHSHGDLDVITQVLARALAEAKRGERKAATSMREQAATWLEHKARTHMFDGILRSILEVYAKDIRALPLK